MTPTATYDPADNKIRLYPATRLPKDVYDRVKAAGFKWAPKQELFVAPMWTPEREDLLLELCGEIGDEDTSLVERAAERSERFEEYSDKREADAESAHAAVERITDGIPLGQPILVGHHSERHARKDAERIENGMRKAVRMWETSKYWTDRAAGAIRHAKYKELPSVRARRIKGIEADKRKAERSKAEAETFRKLWAADGLTLERAVAIANRDHVSQCFPLATYPRDLPASQYEGAMSLWGALTDGVVPFQTARSIAVNRHNDTIQRANRWIGHYENRLAYERAMMVESGGIAADKVGPEVGGGCRCWASPRGGWSYIRKVNKVSVTVEDNWGNGGKNFTRTVPFDKLSALMTKAQVEEARAAGRLVESATKDGFFLADKMPEPKPYTPSEPTKFDALKDTLAAGVQVVTAPNLFPTPPEIARQVVALAEIEPGMTVLEPSAGTGNLIRAVLATGAQVADVAAVERNGVIAVALHRSFPALRVQAADFLELAPAELQGFDRIVMNPPFDHGSDIKHVRHALTFLKPGGRLVAVVAHGPRQRDELMPLADEWIDLPAGAFDGTGVRTAIVVIDAAD